MKRLVFGLTLVALLNGCGDSLKSVEEYQKLSKTELDSMLKTCKEEIDKYTAYPKSVDNLEAGRELEKKIKQHEREILEIAEKIYEDRGEKFSSVARSMMGIGWYGQISDDELKKFGNSTFLEYAKCGRIAIARDGGFENARPKTIGDKYKNVGKE